MLNNKNSNIESCILVAEVNGYSYHYNVAIPEIESSIKTIVVTYDELEQPISRVYIAGFNLVSEGTNLSKEKFYNSIY